MVAQRSKSPLPQRGLKALGRPCYVEILGIGGAEGVVELLAKGQMGLGRGRHGGGRIHRKFFVITSSQPFRICTAPALQRVVCSHPLERLGEVGNEETVGKVGTQNAINSYYFFLVFALNTKSILSLRAAMARDILSIWSLPLFTINPARLSFFTSSFILFAIIFK